MDDIGEETTADPGEAMVDLHEASGEPDQTNADLRTLQERAERRRKHCDGKYSFYEHLDNGVILLAGLTAGLAGVSAVLDAERRSPRLVPSFQPR